MSQTPALPGGPELGASGITVMRPRHRRENLLCTLYTLLAIALTRICPSGDRFVAYRPRCGAAGVALVASFVRLLASGGLSCETTQSSAPGPKQAEQTSKCRAGLATICWLAVGGVVMLLS